MSQASMMSQAKGQLLHFLFLFVSNRREWSLFNNRVSLVRAPHLWSIVVCASHQGSTDFCRPPPIWSPRLFSPPPWFNQIYYIQMEVYSSLVEEYDVSVTYLFFSQINFEFIIVWYIVSQEEVIGVRVPTEVVEHFYAKVTICTAPMCHRSWNHTKMAVNIYPTCTTNKYESNIRKYVIVQHNILHVWHTFGALL